MEIKELWKRPEIQEILKELNYHEDEEGRFCDCHLEAVFTEADLCPEGERLKTKLKLAEAKILAEE